MHTPGSDSEVMYEEEDKLSILIIEPLEENSLQISEALQKEIGAISIRRAGSLGEASETLDNGWADLVLVAQTLPDGTSLDVLSLAREAMVPIPVVVHLPEIDEELQLRYEREGAACSICGPLQPRAWVYPVRMLSSLARHLGRVRRHLQESRLEQLRVYDSIRATVSRVNHEINNPLSIISGNVQLLLELTRAMDLEEEILKPLEDIEEASERVARLLKGLSEIKDVIPKRPV